ncbi:hypothetical protein H257_17170 [Aphanomyces astaci]|uniref:NAD-dependent epimerase/dehydratase domain-containing protein n=3 Tax=Aphanomyces astaci TaxID=112090 RepID=W4FHT0_APHAT|nr:hypothetical protein H257_17170 [Aphanomyces astaci]ETV66386.1 hypothetical protein H257_17170 [Aphanomyces astaci]|eukprot:XP_009844161.1 hypothetical protein H257_17170 [Aphanomyces astaci]
MATSLPRILVLGGVGMIGRNFVKYCVDNDLCSYIRVADKSMPEISYFSERHKAAFASDIVEYVQADLTRDAHVDRAFKADTGPYDYVFNLAGETKCGQAESVYSSKCRDLAVKCARKARDMHVKTFVEVSTAYVYKSQTKSPADERAKLDPWTLQAKYKLQAEEELRALDDLHVVFVRPATVYGSGDVGGLMPRLVCAAAYSALGEKMKLLWDGEMRVNTVHVLDVCKALWHVARVGAPHEVYNLADKSDTSQRSINQLVEALFGVETGFVGVLVSNLAKLRLDDVVDTANEKHMKPWSDLCHAHGVTNTPLTPYMDKELLGHNHLYVDGTKIETTGFEYTYPSVQLDQVRALVQDAIDQRMFPPVLA